MVMLMFYVILAEPRGVNHGCCCTFTSTNKQSDKKNMFFWCQYRIYFLIYIVKSVYLKLLQFNFCNKDVAWLLRR